MLESTLAPDTFHDAVDARNESEGIYVHFVNGDGVAVGRSILRIGSLDPALRSSPMQAARTETR